MNNKDLLYSTGNYIPYLVMERHLKKNRYIHIWISESLCCVPETNRTLYINYTSIKKKKCTSIIASNIHLQTASKLGRTSLYWILPSVPSHGVPSLCAPSS